MKLKDWEIYNKASKTFTHQQTADRVSTIPVDPSKPLPHYIEELHRTVEQLEALPEAEVELATRILKQFLR